MRAYLEFELSRLLRSRTLVAGLSVFVAAIALGTFAARSGASGFEDRLFGLAFVAASCVIVQVNIGIDRASYFQEFAITNLVSPTVFVTAKLVALASVVLGFAAFTLLVGVPAFGFDVGQAAWYAGRMGSALWLLLPGILATELLTGVRIPTPLFLMIVLIVVISLAGVIDVNALSGALGLSAQDRSWSSLSRTVWLDVTVVPIALVLIGTLWSWTLDRPV